MLTAWIETVPPCCAPSTRTTLELASTTLSAAATVTTPPSPAVPSAMKLPAQSTLSASMSMRPPLVPLASTEPSPAKMRVVTAIAGAATTASRAISVRACGASMRTCAPASIRPPMRTSVGAAAAFLAISSTTPPAPLALSDAPAGTSIACAACSLIRPPASVPLASIAPCARIEPVSACTVISPPCAPFASMLEPGSSSTSFAALKTILPPSPTTAREADTRPAFLTNVP